MRVVAVLAGAVTVAVGLLVAGWMIGGAIVQAIEEAAEALP